MPFLHTASNLAGTYRPRIRIYELEQLSLKCERFLDAEVVQFQVSLQPVLALSALTSSVPRFCQRIFEKLLSSSVIVQ